MENFLAAPPTDDHLRSAPEASRPRPVPLALYLLPTGRFAQVSFLPDLPPDLAEAMPRHRTAVQQAAPVRELDQYVVIVGDGRVRAPDDPVHTGRQDGVNVLHLKDIETEWFPISPAFNRLLRSQTAPAASEILEWAGAAVETFEVTSAAELLPGLDESPTVLPSLLVSLLFSGRFGVPPSAATRAGDPKWAEALTATLALYAIAQFEDVRQRISRREGICDVLGDVLRECFGEHPDLTKLAYRLAARTDLDTVIQIITTSTDLDELYSRYLPTACG